MNTFKKAALSAITTFLLCTACGNSIDRTGLDKDPTVLPDGVNVESWGIGDRWYNYEFQGQAAHTVLPAERAFLVQHPTHGTLIFGVTNYYHIITGESAMPTVAFRRWNGNAWGERVLWTAPSRIYNGELCLSFEGFTSVDCTSDNYDLIWRSNNRPVPEMGFAIGNPGIYVTPGAGITVHRFDNYRLFSNQSKDVLPESPELALGQDGVEQVGTPLDAAPNPMLPTERLIEGASIFQLTADLRFVEWGAALTPAGADNDASVTFSARCVAAARTAVDTPDFTGAPSDLALTLADETQRWTFIDLCGDEGPEVVQSSDSLAMGQWPNNTTFDLVLENIGTNFRVYVAPDQPITVNEGDAFAATTPVPLLLWSDPDYALSL